MGFSNALAQGLGMVGGGLAGMNPRTAQMAQLAQRGMGRRQGPSGPPPGFASYNSAKPFDPSMGQMGQTGAGGLGPPPTPQVPPPTQMPMGMGAPQPPQPPVNFDPEDDMSVTSGYPAARGSIVNKPTKMLLGERGPEAVVPLTRPRNPSTGVGAGMVSPAAFMPGMGRLPMEPRYEGSQPGAIRTPPPLSGGGGRIGGQSLQGPAGMSPALKPRFGGYTRGR